MSYQNRNPRDRYPGDDNANDRNAANRGNDDNRTGGYGGNAYDRDAGDRAAYENTAGEYGAADDRNTGNSGAYYDETAAGYGGRGYGTSWISWINVVVGIWEIFAPWIWGYAFIGQAVANDVIVGILIVIFAFWAAVARSAWPSWVNVVLGIWLIIAPFALLYSFSPRAEGNDIVVGIVVGILALVAALSRPASYRRPANAAT